MPKKSFRRRGLKTSVKKQRIYKQKGCSKSRRRGKSQRRSLKGGNQNDPIAPFSWKQMNMRGGQCDACGLMKGGQCDTCGLMKGGSFYKPAAPVPNPLVGQPWGPAISSWPGVNGIGGDRNYLANNLYKHGDPQTMMKIGGSKKKRGKRKGLNGGSIFPQDLINLGRDMSFNFKSAYNSLNGYPSPVNPLPYKDQLSGSMSANRIII